MNMDVEILAAEYNSESKTIEILAIDTSQERLERLERNRVDRDPEITFRICLESKKGYYYFMHWINSQKAVKDADSKLPTRITLFQALQAVTGTDTMISSKYRVYED